MTRKPKCVLILTEGKSDRSALSGLFQDIYSCIDEDIEVFFPILKEDSFNNNGDKETHFDGDITSRNGVDENNILGLLMKMFIHPELEKHPAYKTPSSICEIIHLVDIDGAFLNKRNVLTAPDVFGKKLPHYDVANNTIVARDRSSIVDRNIRKRKNLEKLISTRKLNVTLSAESGESREKPYRVYYFSSNLDHVLHGDANMPSYLKVPHANRFANEYDNWKDMAKFLLNHPCAVTTKNYLESWEILMNSNTLSPMTNINLLIADLLKRANVKL